MEPSFGLPLEASDLFTHVMKTSKYLNEPIYISILIVFGGFRLSNFVTQILYRFDHNIHRGRTYPKRNTDDAEQDSEAATSSEGEIATALR